MKVLFYLGHPAHFHLFKNAIEYFNKNGEVRVLIKKKDVLARLLENAGIKYKNIYDKTRGDSYFSMGAAMLKKDWQIAKEAFRFKPKIMIGSAPEIAQVGQILRIPSLLFGEDDIHVVSQSGFVAYPFASSLVSPYCCNKGKWDKKTTKYNSYHELAYLHPNHFIPKKEVLKRCISTNDSFFLLRFSKLNAFHDAGRKGINSNLAVQLVKLLEKKGKVYISSERKLPPELEKYQLNIDPLDMHHMLSYASLYIGDSQTMTAEAAVLGTPAIRFNDFVGEIGYLEELEHKYGLTKGVKTTNPDLLLKLADELSNPAVKEEFSKRRKNMLKEKIDFSKFMIWFIEKYPESKNEMKKNPDIQYKFK